MLVNCTGLGIPPTETQSKTLGRRRLFTSKKILYSSFRKKKELMKIDITHVRVDTRLQRTLFQEVTSNAIVIELLAKAAVICSSESTNLSTDILRPYRTFGAVCFAPRLLF
jgi:hypothetical protein